MKNKETFEAIIELVNNLFPNIKAEIAEGGELVMYANDSIVDEIKAYVKEIPDCIYLDVLNQLSEEFPLSDTNNILNGDDVELQENLFNVLKKTTESIAEKTVAKLTDLYLN